MPLEPASSSATLPAPKPGRKYFTLAEANRSLPYVRRVVDDVVAVYGRVVELRRRIEKPKGDDVQEELEARYESAMDELSTFVDELHQVGVEMKDFDKGLVDFPAIHSDREVYLCWKKGEQAIGFWHEVDAGYAARQPVSTLGQ